MVSSRARGCLLAATASRGRCSLWPHVHPCHVLWDVAGMPCGALTPPSSGLEPWTLTRQSEGSIALEQLGSRRCRRACPDVRPAPGRHGGPGSGAARADGHVLSSRRIQDPGGERDTPDSFVPSSSPESVVGMEVTRYPDLSLVKEEPPEPVPSPIIPILPSTAGKGGRTPGRDVPAAAAGLPGASLP